MDHQAPGEHPEERTPQDEAVRAAVRTALSVSVATGLYGVSFGALSTVAGLSVAQTMVLSLLMFSGGSQFALVGVVGSGGSGLSAVLTAGFLGVRNAVYGIRLGPLLALDGWRRALAAHLTIDESTAVATAQPDRASARAGFWWAGGGVFVLWNVLVLAGALAGDTLGEPGRWGLDAAAAAAFLGLLWPRLASREVRLVVLVAAVAAAALIPVTPPGVPVLAAGAAAVVLAQVVPSRGGPDDVAVGTAGDGPDGGVPA